MARAAFAASALLSLFLLAAAHRLPSEVDFLPAFRSDAAAIRLPSDKPSEESVPIELLPSDKPFKESVPKTPAAAGLLPSDKPSEESAPKTTAAEFLPSDKPSKFISKREEAAIQSILPAADAIASTRTVPIEVSLIPVRDFSFAHPRLVGRPSWRRLGRHCHHLHRFLRGDVRRAGDLIPFGNDMIVPAEQVRRGYEGGRYFAGGARTGGFHHPAVMEEISVEDLGKQRQMGFHRELRPLPRFRHHGLGDEKDRGGLVKRFLDLLNGH